MYTVLLSLRASQYLREAIRPLAETPYGQIIIIKFCEKLYSVLLHFETRQVVEVAVMPLTVEEVMIINHFIGVEDGDWARDLLEQTRAVLYEWSTGKSPVYLADPQVMAELLHSADTEAIASPTGSPTPPSLEP